MFVFVCGIYAVAIRVLPCRLLARIGAGWGVGASNFGRKLLKLTLALTHTDVCFFNCTVFVNTQVTTNATCSSHGYDRKGEVLGFTIGIRTVRLSTDNNISTAVANETLCLPRSLTKLFQANFIPHIHSGKTTAVASSPKGLISLPCVLPPGAADSQTLPPVVLPILPPGPFRPSDCRRIQHAHAELKTNVTLKTAAVGGGRGARTQGTKAETRGVRASDNI